MPYSRSTHRRDFEARIDSLLSEARKASRLNGDLREVRDMVFQCAIFQTSAALESYLRLIIEGWFQKLKDNNRGDKIPHPARARYFAKTLGPSFENYALNGDESKIFKSLESRDALWEFMRGAAQLPSYMSGSYLHENMAYPSNRNLKRLFVRIGIGNIHDAISSILQRDAETLIEGFQSVRTNLAHSSPDDITLADVKRLLGDIVDFVRAVDRVLYRHVIVHGGAPCWS